MTKKKLIGKIVDNREKVRGYGVRKIGLFGSHARGDATAKSDVDILVEFKEKNFDNYMGLKFFLEALFKAKVDLVINSALKPQLRSSVLKQVEYVKGI
ncbi:MAG: nucleotidyltransferase family protein [bacterium]